MSPILLKVLPFIKVKVSGILLLALVVGTLTVLIIVQLIFRVIIKKKTTERFIKELEKAYKLTKRTKRVKMGLSDNGSANVGRNDLRLEVYMVE